MTFRSQVRKHAPSSILNIYRSLLLITKKILPTKWVIWYFNRSKAAKFKNKNTEEVFEDIYKKSIIWGSKESVSGSGSTIAVTKTLVQELDYLLPKYQITTLLDIPCGDFNWMKTVKLDEINYKGGDIVKELIEANRREYSNKENLQFSVLNLIKDTLPKSDLIFIRDCFVHLSYGDIYRSIKNIKNSDAKYLMTTTFPENKENYDIVTGGWRSLNFQKPPFNFPEPIELVSENYKSYNGEYEDKSMGIYKVEDIALPNIPYE